MIHYINVIKEIVVDRIKSIELIDKTIVIQVNDTTYQLAIDSFDFNKIKTSLLRKDFSASNRRVVNKFIKENVPPKYLYNFDER